jgi:hypothetical protein
VTLIEAAAILGVTPDTLRQQIAAGKLRARKVIYHAVVWEIRKYRANLDGPETVKEPHDA